MNPNRIQKRIYAVATRDGQDLFLILRICRMPKGDIYVEFPRYERPKWNPHSSYHASGQHHQKSVNRIYLVRHGQKPDANFKRTEDIVTTGIASDEPRLINTLCRATDFQEVFEIPVGELRPEQYRTYLSVNITEANGSSIITPDAKILRQAIFQDSVPWILVTLFETDTDNAFFNLFI